MQFTETKEAMENQQKGIMNYIIKQNAQVYLGICQASMMGPFYENTPFFINNQKFKQSPRKSLIC